MNKIFAILAIALCIVSVYGANFNLNPQEVANLKTLLSQDAGAMKLYNGYKGTANWALTQNPKPVPCYISAGLLQGNPIKTKSQQAGVDYGIMYALAWAYKVEGDPKYLDKLIQYFTAWAKINKSQGAPVDDSNMEAVIEAYDLVQADIAVNNTAANVQIQNWLRQFATQEMYHSQVVPGPGTGTNNWNAARIMIVGYVGITLNDQSIIGWTIGTLQKFLPTNLYADGSSFDYRQRDALHYHCYNLEPLLKLAIALKRVNKGNFYTYNTTSGASMQKSIQWLTPFINGTLKHAEYVHSTVPFDRQRANNGQSDYSIGHLWGVGEGATVTGPAHYFDATLLNITQVAVRNNGTYPTWQIVLNQAMHSTLVLAADIPVADPDPTSVVPVDAPTGANTPYF